MAPERPVTPEKQLLKLIEESAAKGSGPSQTRALRYQGLSFFSPGAWIGRISYGKAKINKWLSGQEHFRLEVRIVNHFLLLLLGGMVAYALVYSYGAYANLRRIMTVGISAPQGGASGGGAREVPSLDKPSSYYQEKAAQRDIFKMGPKKIEVKNQEPSSKTLELAQNLRLVGISWSDDPDAMVEDKKLSKTFFIKKGQMVGEATVKAIAKDKVVLEVDGEEFELR